VGFSISAKSKKKLRGITGEGITEQSEGRINMLKIWEKNRTIVFKWV
jgi:hypothetical protein